MVLESELKLEWSQIKELEQILKEMIDFNKSIAEKNQYFKEKLQILSLNEKMLSNFDVQYPEILLNCITDLFESRKNKFYEIWSKVVIDGQIYTWSL